MRKIQAQRKKHVPLLDLALTSKNMNIDYVKELLDLKYPAEKTLLTNFMQYCPSSNIQNLKDMMNIITLLLGAPYLDLDYPYHFRVGYAWYSTHQNELTMEELISYYNNCGQNKNSVDFFMSTSTKTESIVEHCLEYERLGLLKHLQNNGLTLHTLSIKIYLLAIHMAEVCGDLRFISAVLEFIPKDMDVTIVVLHIFELFHKNYRCASTHNIAILNSFVKLKQCDLFGNNHFWQYTKQGRSRQLEWFNFKNYCNGTISEFPLFEHSVLFLLKLHQVLFKSTLPSVLIDLIMSYICKDLQLYIMADIQVEVNNVYRKSMYFTPPYFLPDVTQDQKRLDILRYLCRLNIKDAKQQETLKADALKPIPSTISSSRRHGIDHQRKQK